MILIGIEDCPTCKIAKKLLPGVAYIELKRKKLPGEITSDEILTIKKALGKLNIDGHFPIMLNDDYTRIITTDNLLNNLTKNKLQSLLEK